jgi:hypothetical protein
MNRFIPTLTLGVALPKQVAWEDKFGGLPWGFPLDLWPVCEECEEPLTFLAQLRHQPGRIDLGGENRVLYLFQCEGDDGCSTWEVDGGTNAVLILEQDQLGSKLTESPDEETYILPELRVTEWTKQGDDEQIETKLGGTPDWIQGDASPAAPYHFVGQIDSYLSCTKHLPDQDRIIQDVVVNGYHSISVSPEYGNPFWVSIDDDYRVDFANFGDMGVGYLFVNSDPLAPTGKFLWQCS